MSLYRTDYILYGWKLPYDFKNNENEEISKIWSDDKYLPYIEGRPGIKYTIVLDQMMGKYMFFGKTIEIADSWFFKELDINFLDNGENQKIEDELLRLKFIELFGIELDIRPILFITSQYS